MKKIIFLKKKGNLNVILISGVNGSGKTTTIENLEKFLKKTVTKLFFLRQILSEQQLSSNWKVGQNV